jgi:hypothetical protein
MSSNDHTMKMDVAGSLFTSMHRNVKIKGEEPAAMNLEGTGSVSVLCWAGRQALEQQLHKDATGCVAAAECSLLLLLLFLQCFDTTMPSEARAGAHVPLNMPAKELPRWSKALTQYRCERSAQAPRCLPAHAPTVSAPAATSSLSLSQDMQTPQLSSAS